MAQLSANQTMQITFIDQMLQVCAPVCVDVVIVCVWQVPLHGALRTIEFASVPASSLIVVAFDVAPSARAIASAAAMYAAVPNAIVAGFWIVTTVSLCVMMMVLCVRESRGPCLEWCAIAASVGVIKIDESSACVCVLRLVRYVC
jgi:hypothetical protein